jgi:polysaccharide export outer membrane protein
MKSSSFGWLAVLAVLWQATVFEAAYAQEPGANRGVQTRPVFLEQSTPASIGHAASESEKAGGTGNPVLGRERRPLYRLNKSDVLQLSFALAPEFDQTVTVQPDGYITLKDVGHLVAEGATLEELELSIRNAYNRIFHDPVVTVTLKDFDRPYFVAAGEVTKPGKYELRGDTTVTTALAEAGGFTQQARHSQVVLFRRVTPDLAETRVLNVKAMLKHHDLKEDLLLKPGDYLFVPRSTISNLMRFVPATSLGMYSTPGRF